MYDESLQGCKKNTYASQCISLALIHLKSLDRLKVINIVLRYFFLLINFSLRAAMCFHLSTNRTLYWLLNRSL